MNAIRIVACLLALLAVGCRKDDAGRGAAEVEKTTCDACGRRLAPGHDCLAVDRCLTCGRDVRRGHVCSVTTICRLGNPECLFEVGHEHVHGKTHWCMNCRSEVAANHMRNEVGRCLTRYCPTCQFDVVRPDAAERLLRQKVLHVCGATHFCPRCMTEVAANHVCDVTRYCATCRKDVSFPYCPECLGVVGRNRSERCEVLERLHPVGAEGKEVAPGPVMAWCPHCGKDVPARDHVCFATEFCPRCRRETPIEHTDQE